LVFLAYPVKTGRVLGGVRLVFRALSARCGAQAAQVGDEAVG
jgi:hypothetical protein